MFRSKNELVLLAPLTGPVVPLDAVPDPVFSGGMLGDGIAIDPLSTTLLAPCDGTITCLARTAHALTLTTSGGAEILLQIGIDTVDLKGRGFTAKVRQGATVRTGDALIEFDADYVAQHAPSLVSVIAVANGDAFEVIERAGNGMLSAGRSMLLKLRATPDSVSDSKFATANPNPPERAQRAPGRPIEPKTLAGVCAAPGIAVGKLVRWGDDADITPPEIASGTVAAENGLLDKALATADAELTSTVRSASQRGALGEADIFAAHRALLEDSTLLDAARNLIGVGKSAGFAWHETIRTHVALLERLDDALLAERASDLRDIGKRVLRALGLANTRSREVPEDAVLVAEEFTPSDLSGLDTHRVMALVMARGGATAHAAIIARQLGIAALVAVGDALRAIPEGTRVIVDATAGRLECAPTELDVERAQREHDRLAGVHELNRETSRLAAVTIDGRAIEVAANIATLDDARAAVDNGADSVGLLRTELLFIHRPEAPTAVQHQDTYQSIVDALQGRTAIIRTLDVGADKEVDYLTLPPEPNPALGLHGIRLAQVRPDLLDEQLRGLLAVQPVGAVRVLLPMVTDAGELIRLRARIDELAHQAGRTEPVEVGAMIEVPSAALLADQPTFCRSVRTILRNTRWQWTAARQTSPPRRTVCILPCCA
jgi:phosphocarrier protein FPr